MCLSHFARAGEHGPALVADAEEILQALIASVADISGLEPATQAAAPIPMRRFTGITR